jgi:hypothetical protein
MAHFEKTVDNHGVSVKPYSHNIVKMASELTPMPGADTTKDENLHALATERAVKKCHRNMLI